MDLISAPGTPSTTTSGDAAALMDATPRSCMDEDVFGLDVSVMVIPEILPFRAVAMVEPPWPASRSFEEMEVMELVTAFFSIVP